MALGDAMDMDASLWVAGVDDIEQQLVAQLSEEGNDEPHPGSSSSADGAAAATPTNTHDDATGWVFYARSWAWWT